MKVLMVTPFPKDPSHIAGGVAGVSVYLVKALSEIPDVSVDVVAFNADSPEEYFRDFGSYGVHYVPGVQGRGAFVRLLDRSKERLATKISQLSADIVHVQADAGIACLLDRPCVLTIHGIAEKDSLYRGRCRWAKSRLRRFLEGRKRRKVRNIILISPYVRDVIRPHLVGRTWDIENPVADCFFQAAYDPQPGRILFAGLLSQRKNVLGLIRAFAALSERNDSVYLRIAGGGTENSYGRACQHMAKQLRVSDRVRFLGQLSIEQMRGELSRASCMALCSFQETAPLVIEEAMALGVPVVTSRLCGMPYMVEHGQTGMLVDPRDTAGIAAAIEKVLTLGSLEAMANRARAQANNRFRASIVAEKTFEVYKTILCDAPSGRA